MHNVVGFVFKFLGLSLVVMMIFFTVLTTIEILGVRSEVKPIVSAIATVVAENNYLPEELATQYKKQLDLINEKYPLVTGFTTNINSYVSISSGGKSQQFYSLADQRGYGESVDVMVQINVTPYSYFVNSNPKNGESLVTVDKFTIRPKITRTVITQRYLR